MKYIPLDALVAEIEKWISGWNERLTTTPSEPSFFKGGIELGKHILSFLDTLEVKEVDLEKEVTEYLNNFENANIGHRLSLRRCAKHFFSLGLQASNPLTWEDMMTIHKCCKDAMNCNLYTWETAEGQQKIYEDVLKRFKAQKGE